MKVKSGEKLEAAPHVAPASSTLAEADPNFNTDSESALWLAARAGHHSVVKTLILRGTDPNARNPMGQAPIHLAAAEGHALCVSQLLAGGADKDSRNRQSLTPLLVAVLRNHLSVVEELLAAGANLKIRVTYSEYFLPNNALDMAAHQGYVEVVRALLAHGSRVSSSFRGRTPLHRAVVFATPGPDNGGVIRVLLEAGADIEAKTSAGHTPLHVAASQFGCRGEIRALMEGGANVNSRDKQGGTPLFAACTIPSVGAVEELLHWGADERLVDHSGSTAEDKLGKHNHGDTLREQLVVRHMLARASADRFWRRRGCLVLARSRPAKVQLAQDSDGGGSGNNGSSDTTPKASYGGGERNGDNPAGWVRLVGRVVNLDVEGVFRLVVGFL